MIVLLSFLVLIVLIPLVAVHGFDDVGRFHVFGSPKLSVVLCFRNLPGSEAFDVVFRRLMLLMFLIVAL